MKVSGKDVAEVILKKLAAEIKAKNLQPGFAIILANESPASQIYVENKIKEPKEVKLNPEPKFFWKKELPMGKKPTVNLKLPL